MRGNRNATNSRNTNADASDHMRVSIKLARFARFAALLALATTVAAAPAPTPVPDPTPLLTFAAAQTYPPLFDPKEKFRLKKQLDRVTFDLAKDPPPEMNCAQTLGARRFATLLDDLGSAYTNMGDETKAADAFAKAIGCDPRASFLHAELAAALLDAGHYSEARAETQRELSLGHASFSIYSLLTQLDFIAGHWPEAVSNAKLAATEAPDDEQATYWQCFLWIAQKHAGLQEPVLVNRRIPPDWPAPILQSLQGKITEAELVEAVKAEEDLHRQREILTEALFYTGQQRLTANRTDEAIRYFTATVGLDVQYFIEHHLAVAELEKLHHPVTSQL